MPGRGSRHGSYHRLNIITIDMEDRCTKSFGHISAVWGAATLLRVSGECHLEVHQFASVHNRLPVRKEGSR